MVAGVIEFPASPAPNGVNVTPVDAGFHQRGPSGAPTLRVDRPGNHWMVEVSFPPMKAEAARRFVSRVTRAKREGLRVAMPLLHVYQGAPGSPVVDGADQTGTTLHVRNLTPHYAVKEGFWLHVEDAAGQRYLHQVGAPGVAGADGRMAIVVEPPIRAEFADGCRVELAKPTVEGALVESVGWNLAIDRLVRFGGTLTIEEAD